MSDSIHHEVARLKLRHQAAQADLKVAKAKAEVEIIGELGSAFGKNAEERERQLILGLASHTPYQAALHLARAFDEQLAFAEATLEAFRDARRAEEWSIRARLADAIAQRVTTSDRPGSDESLDDLTDAEFLGRYDNAEEVFGF